MTDTELFPSNESPEQDQALARYLAHVYQQGEEDTQALKNIRERYVAYVQQHTTTLTETEHEPIPLHEYDQPAATFSDKARTRATRLPLSMNTLVAALLVLVVVGSLIVMISRVRQSGGAMPSVPQQKPLLSIHMTDATTGWALATDDPGGSKPTRHVWILHTTDGGTHWQDVTPPHMRIQQDQQVFFLSSSTAWMFAPASSDMSISRNINAVNTKVILRTIDGGKTWQEQSRIVIADSSWLRFISPDEGWLTSQPSAQANATPLALQFDQFHTVDGGKHWTKIASNYASITSGIRLPDQNLETSGIFFTSATDGWVTGFIDQSTGMTSKLYHTHDGGQTWQEMQLLDTLAQGSPQGPAFLWMKGQDLVLQYAASRDTFHAGKPFTLDTFFATTHDGGAHWLISKTIHLPGMMVTSDNMPSRTYMVSFSDALHGKFIYGTALYVTQDGGQNWQTSKVITRLPKQANNLTFVSDTIGFIVSRSIPYLLKTTDGGRTWQPVNFTIS